MSLIDEITQLRDATLSSLDASHDYYVHTQYLWRLLQQMVREGHEITVENQATGNTVRETELAGLAQSYMTGYLASATFQHFVSSFERFVFDFLRLWLTEYPGSLANHQLTFRTVLDARDKSTIVDSVVQKEVHTLAYQRLADWFEYLQKIANLGYPELNDIERLAEIKATRDVLVHNNGIANSIYVDKAMGQARCAEGAQLELPENYHRQSWQLIRRIVDELANAAVTKLNY